jgi:hypothetical protein
MLNTVKRNLNQFILLIYMNVSPDSEDQDWLKQIRIKNEVIWYGERGVVNALLTSLTSKNQMRSFLNLIEWADEEKITDDYLDVENSKTIVELGLNDFGDPDIILVTKNEEDEKKFFFIEAKTGSYNENTASNQYGMVQGYNSKINGQISLKYRFVKALENWDGKTTEITESQRIYEVYTKILDDYCQNPRTLKHKTIIEHILIPNGFAEANLENSFFIALTSENPEYNPFLDADNIENLPVFLDENSDNLWERLKGHVGLIKLEDVKRLGLGAEFEDILDIMSRTVKERSVCQYPRLRTSKLTGFDDEDVDFCMKLGEYLVDSMDGVVLQRLAGSFSLLDETGVVMAKIILRDDEIWFGVRGELDNLREFEDRGNWCIVNTPFQFVNVLKGRIDLTGNELCKLL